MTPQPIPMSLTGREIIRACVCGALRQFDVMENKRRPTCGDPLDYKGFMGNHLLGACAELAVANYLHLPWGETINTWSLPDLQGRIEVKLRRNHTHELIVRPDQDDSYHMILVTGDNPTAFMLRGWITAGDAKRREYWGDRGGYDKPAFWFPQAALRPMTELTLTGLTE